MNWKAWAPLAVALVLGLVAAITARNLVNRRPAAVTGATGPTVVVVTQPVQPGQEIKPDDVTTAPLAWKEAPEGTFTNAADVVGRVPVVPLVKGQPVIESVLAAQGSGSGLQALVPEGMRAITIEVNEFSAIAGLIGPGCSVDVVATIEDARTKDRLAKTIVQDVKVMAVGQRVSSVTPAAAVKGAPIDAPVVDQLFKSVTLLTTPTEAEAIELASMVGRPRLVLRGQRDTAAAKSNGVTLAQLVGSPDAPAAELLTPGTFDVKPVAMTSAPTTRPVATQQHVVKVIKGGVESTVTFNVQPQPEQQQQGGDTSVITNTDLSPAFRQ